MGIKYSFIDSTVYGTDDINDITRSLTGAGVAPFVSKDSYNVSDLNVMTTVLVGAGTSLDGCKCSLKNAGTAEMTITVSQGIIFFESGIRLMVDEEGYSIAAAPNTAGYVYAHFSPSLQKAEFVFGDKLPTDGEYVALAEISADGILSDTRTFAESKVASIGKNIAYETEVPYHDLSLYYRDDKIEKYAIATFDVNLERFNYVLVSGGGFSVSGIFSLSEGVFKASANSYNGIGGNSPVFLDVTYGKYGLQVVEGKLVLYYTQSVSYPYSPSASHEIDTVIFV